MEEICYAVQTLLSIKLMSVSNSLIVINDLSMNLKGETVSRVGPTPDEVL